MIRFVFVLWCLVISSVSIFGQTLDADLKKSFNKHSVIKINDQEALKKAKNQEPFKFMVDGKIIQFILTPNEIRSEKYKAEYTSASGVHSLPRGEVFTYTGKLIGEKDSVLAFTVDGKITEGFFSIGREDYYLEAAKKYSSHAGNDDKVVYQTKDKVKKDDFVCGLDEAVAKEIDRTSASVKSATASSPQQEGIKIIELATEADYQWVTLPRFGGDAETANNYILSLINGVDVIYRRDLNLTIRVTFQHAWTTQDNYQGTDTGITLEKFRLYWKANYPYAQYPRDLAHLFTGKHLSQGLSFEDVVCVNLDYSYGLSGYIENEAARTALTAHEIGHNLGGHHEESTGECANTIMNPSVTSTTTRFCETSKTQIRNFITSYGSCLDLEPVSFFPRTLFDFDADSKADIGVFRPSNTYWYIQQSAAGFFALAFGLATDKLAPADYDNDGKTDIAVFRDDNWYIQRSTQGFIGVSFGAAGDIPVPGDFDGDGQAELVVFRPSTGFWYTYNLANSQTGGIFFGQNGDKPLMGDFDNDRRNDYAVFRNGTWYIQRSTRGFLAVSFGNGTDTPAPADYDRDGQTDIAVFRPSDGVWSVQRSTGGFYSVQFGQSGDIPNPADYDGDRKADISLFRPSTGVWHRINSSTNSAISIAFGQSGDIPIPSFNVVQ
ncbi:MAG: M12 family metallo-peptidase [Acidobacteria bacterium]|nr:M12 family metallo-peptidase [Acidobacteriota bacterium]MCA1639363.1 M12 family metallo-peptidase [Acidobacteriota bacterium]